MSPQFDLGSTKGKILSVASELFAKKGFDGTSIRDIAQLAEVNVAAINYHFSSKETLYYNVFQNNWLWLESGIAEIGKDNNLDTVQFVEKMHYFFLEHGHALTTTFKIILTDNVKDPDGFFENFNTIGPPGGEILRSFIEKDLTFPVAEEILIWAVGCIFSHLSHSAMIMSTDFYKLKCQHIPFFDPKLKVEFSKELARSILLRLKSKEPFFVK